MKAVLRALLLLVLLPLGALAQGLPDPMSDRINDFADLLSPEAEARIAERIQRGRAETGVQVVVVTMERMAQNGGVGEPIEDYAKRLFNAWGIGDSTRDDGILLLVARTDRQARIALGAAYPVIWDNAAQRVIDRNLLPALREDRYADGVEAAVAATFDLIVTPFQAGASRPLLPGDGPLADQGSGDGGGDWTGPGLMAGFLLVIGGLVLRDRLSGRTGTNFSGAFGAVLLRLRQCKTCGRRGLVLQQDFGQTGTEGAADQTLVRLRCLACGATETLPPPRSPSRSQSSTRSGPRHGGDGGDGPSGFGGGTSSGGGASGCW